MMTGKNYVQPSIEAEGKITDSAKLRLTELKAAFAQSQQQDKGGNR